MHFSCGIKKILWANNNNNENFDGFACAQHVLYRMAFWKSDLGVIMSKNLGK